MLILCASSPVSCFSLYWPAAVRRARSICAKARHRAPGRPSPSLTSRCPIRASCATKKKTSNQVAFSYRSGVLCADEVPLDEIARRFGTPCFVYSATAIEAAYREYAEALKGREARICYSVKANSNLAILALLARLGAGFDIVSGGELARVIAAGGEPRRTLFSGVGKSESEIAYALQQGIACINLESEAELARVERVARQLGRRAPIAFRVNPDIDARTHPYISTGLRENKFGVAHADAERLY